jgi:hypothetical protein
MDDERIGGVSTTLPDQPGRRRRIWQVVGLGFAVVALIVAVFMLHVQASGRAGSVASPSLVHMESAGIQFDYPAGWRVISDGFSVHYGAVAAVVGTGDWKLPCWTITPTNGVSGGQCGAETWDIPAGSVVVYISVSYGSPGLPLLSQTPPADATNIGDGIVATDTDASTSSNWVLYLPKGLYVGVDARFAAPGIDTMRAQVRSLAMSLRPVPTA